MGEHPFMNPSDYGIVNHWRLESIQNKLILPAGLITDLYRILFDCYNSNWELG